jgi:hypothetical protein
MLPKEHLVHCIYMVPIKTSGRERIDRERIDRERIDRERIGHQHIRDNPICYMQHLPPNISHVSRSL